MPHIDIERLVLDYSYNMLLCISFGVAASLGIYMSGSNLYNIIKLKLNLKNSLRYKLKIKN